MIRIKDFLLEGKVSSQMHHIQKTARIEGKIFEIHVLELRDPWVTTHHLVIMQMNDVNKE